MIEDRSEQQDQREALERAIQNSQSQVSDVLHRYKADNGAIKHLAIYSMHGNLLAYSPDDEVQNERLLSAQYQWLAQLIGPAVGSINYAYDEFSKNSKKRVPNDFGRPRILRMQTEGGYAVSQIYAAPIDPSALIFVVITSRAPTRRNVYVANEALLLQDMESLIQELLTLVEIKTALSSS